MLITFSSKVHHDVVMFGDVGLAMLRGMGVSDKVPGIVRAPEVPHALQSLRTWLARQTRDPADDEEEEKEDAEEERVPVSLANRALPLVEMLEAAQREEVDVMWE